MNLERETRIREFLATNNLSAWIAWRADELIMMTGHLPYWGMSVLVYPADGAPILFRPEIAAIRLTNRVAKTALKVFHENLVPGKTEAEIAADVESLIHRAIGQDGIHFARGWAMVQSGTNSADGGSFNRSSGRQLEEGDAVMIELSTCVNGYWSDLTRFGALGEPLGRMAEVQAVVAEAQAAAIAAVRPGMSAQAVDAAARDVVSRNGLASFFTHATGHHTGFRYHDPGFALCPGESNLLESGMVLTIEPGIYGRELGGGARLEDNLLVTPNGSEILSHD